MVGVTGQLICSLCFLNGRLDSSGSLSRNGVIDDVGRSSLDLGFYVVG